MSKQKVPFVLVSCVHGTVILNRLDWRKMTETHNEFGVGTDILVNGHAGLDEISIVGGLLERRRESHGPGVVALDVGANIGTFTLEFARLMEEWGVVLAFEPQERIYYALAGNIAINNLFNVRAFQSAVGRIDGGTIEMPVVDYQLPGQFGGLSLRGNGSDIGQKTDQRAVAHMVSIDSMGLPRVDLIKIDVEGMEPDVLEGARDVITRNKPYLFVEWHICGKDPIETFMGSVGYETLTVGMNLICAPDGDTFLPRMREFLATGEAA